MDYELVEVAEPEDWAAYHTIRRQELFKARGRIYDPNRPDERLPGMHHLLLKGEGQPLATTRLDIRDDGTCVFRLVAVTASEQGKGHGRVLGRMVEDKARAHGAHTAYVNAAPTAIGYYEATGWQRHIWDEAELASSECIQMRKAL